jgi:hypothetical protein
MSIPKRSLTIDTPLVQRVIPRVAEIAEELFSASLAAVPGAEALPEGHFTEDVPARIVACSIEVMRAIDEQSEVDADRIRDLVMPIMQRRAEERIPLRVMLTALFGGVRRLWDETTALSEPDDLPDLIAVSHILLEVLMHATIAYGEIHADVEQSVYGDEREARRALCTALLQSAPVQNVQDLAARADTTLADSYTMLSLHVAPADLSNPMADNAVARRRMCIAQQALDTLAGATALHTFDGANGIALLPVLAGGPDQPMYPAIAQDLARQFSVPVVAIEFPDIPCAQLSEAAPQIAEFGMLARRLGRPTGTYLLDDLMFEYQLTRPGPARNRLADRIRPLLEHPHLLEALEAHIRHGSDRKAAAAQVHVHPNSLSYRLRRVAELTGFDPGDPHGSRLLAAALTVHRLYPVDAAKEAV